MKTLSFLLLLSVAFAGCSGASVREKRKEKIFDCTIELIHEDVEAMSAQKVCSKIYDNIKVAPQEPAKTYEL